MLFTYLISRAAIFAAGLSAVAGSPTTGDVAVRSWGPPGVSLRNVVRAVGRSLSAYSHQKRDIVLRNSTSLEKSWEGATLLSYEYTTELRNGTEVTGGIEITCTTCYIKANVQAELMISEAFNVSQAFRDLTVAVGDAIENTTDSTINFVKNYTSSVVTRLSDGFDLDDFDLPPIDVDFDIDIPEIPQCQLRFQFDNLELYVALNTVFSGGVTYTLNLYTSQTPIGIRVSEDLFLGVVVEVDLILSAEAEISINSGFHILVDDGAALSIVLFGNSIDRTAFDGGRFEFLPVTIESAGVVLKAVLRVRARAGFEVSSPDVQVLGVNVFSASAGVEVSIWTHVAELTTNVTFDPTGGETGCQLQVEESYQFVVGAAAGATVALVDHTWGPSPNTTIPLWDTTFTQCALSKSSTITSNTAAITPRQVDSGSLTTTTISTEVTYKGVECMSSGLVVCPASLQRTTKTTTEVTLVTAVPSGVRATFPATTQTTISRPIAFGPGANKLFASAGPPTPYSPGAKEADGSSDGLSDTTKRIIVGVSVGVGSLLIIAAIAGFLFWRRRQRYAAVPRRPPTTPSIGSYRDDPHYHGAAKTSYKTTTAQVH
ncbi:hypothetical protein Dda_6844 [Drechslerella dactyloides]|uniref:Mid2 domain-containing protein n=1 Tax=Drechslerella dactyloides TaxID=74499 RepID=A0AAD6NHS5_DREDA|nr:hypothetical protein Dda_6844 [Drechslerella dactyloides]